MAWASEYFTMQITFTHLLTIIYYALAPTYPVNKLVFNTHKSDNKHRFLLLWNVGYSITENIWVCGEIQASPQIADQIWAISPLYILNIKLLFISIPKGLHFQTLKCSSSLNSSKWQFEVEVRACNEDSHRWPTSGFFPIWQSTSKNIHNTKTTCSKIATVVHHPHRILVHHTSP